MADARGSPIYALPNWRVSIEEERASITVTGWIDVQSNIPTKIKPHLTGVRMCAAGIAGNHAIPGV